MSGTHLAFVTGRGKPCTHLDADLGDRVVVPSLAVSPSRKLLHVVQSAKLTEEEDLVVHALGRIGLKLGNVPLEVVPSFRRSVDHSERTCQLQLATAPIIAC